MPRRHSARPSATLPRYPLEPRLSADAFIIDDSAGNYWTGIGWSSDWLDALLFRQEPEPYIPCRNECLRLRETEGRAATPIHLLERVARLSPRYAEPQPLRGNGSE